MRFNLETWRKFSPVMLTMILSSVGAFADDPTPAQPNYAVALDTMWVLLAGLIVFFMQVGFAFLEAGLHSAKNCVHILLKNMGDFIIGTIVFYVVGFGIMFGEGNSFIGMSGFLLQDEGTTFSSLSWANVPLEAKFWFQLVFAGTATTIVSGAIGGRFRFVTYMAFSALMSAAIYPILGHWVWGGGWLAAQGFFDFAGSTVVHQVGGWAALIGAWMVGPREGRFNRNNASPYPPHNISHMVLGTMILWFGWFGFNPGSTMAIASSSELVSHIFVTTNLGGVAGALVATLVAYVLSRKWDIGATINGLLGGLVAITAGCAFVGNGSAVLIGGIAGFLVITGNFLLESMKIDDAVGAWPVHGLCGLWGTIALGLFASAPYAGGEAQPKLGVLAGGGMEQLTTQLFGSVTVAGATLVATFVVMTLLKFVLGLRVERDEESLGADIAEHGYKAYLGLEEGQAAEEKAAST